MINQKVQKKNFFRLWLEWLNPLLQLSKIEREVLSALLTFHYTYREYNQETLNELLFSEATLKHIQKRLVINDKIFNNILTSLRAKHIINGNIINPSLTKYPKDGKFKLFINFEIEK